MKKKTNEELVTEYYNNPTDEVFEELFENNKGLIYKYIMELKKYKSLNEDEDLLQEAYIVLFEILNEKKFDLDKNIKFQSYLGVAIKRRMADKINEMSVNFKKPTCIKNVKNKQSDRVYKIINENFSSFVSLDTPGIEMASSAPNTDGKLEKETSLLNIINKLKKVLNEKEIEIISIKYGLEDGISKTDQEVADKLGVTKQAINERIKIAFRKVRMSYITKEKIISVN